MVTLKQQQKGETSVVVNFSNGYKVEVSDCEGMSKQEIYTEAKKAMDYAISTKKDAQNK